MSRSLAHVECLRCDRCGAALVVPERYEPPGWRLHDCVRTEDGAVRFEDYCPRCVRQEADGE